MYLTLQQTANKNDNTADNTFDNGLNLRGEFINGKNNKNGKDITKE